MANKSKDLATEHQIKQRKKKNLSDEMVYSSLKGVVEMHKLGELKLSNFDNKTIDTLFSELIKENENVNGRLDKTKTAIKTILGRVETIERKMKKYGLE